MNEEIVTIGGVECLPTKSAARFLGMTISSFYGTVSRYGLTTMNIPHTKNHRAVPVDELRKYQEARNSSRLSERLGGAARDFAPTDRPGSGDRLVPIDRPVSSDTYTTDDILRILDRNSQTAMLGTQAIMSGIERGLFRGPMGPMMDIAERAYAASKENGTSYPHEVASQNPGLEPFEPEMNSMYNKLVNNQLLETAPEG